MNIRPVKHPDLAQVHHLNESVLPHVNSIPVSDFEEFMEISSSFLVIEEEGRVAGFMIVLGPGQNYDSENYEYFTKHYESFDYVDRIVIGEQFRGKGLGSESVSYTHLGKRLTYVRHNYDVNIWNLTLSEDKSGIENTEKYIASTRWDMHPSRSPDGTKVAFTSNRSGTFEVWVGDRDGSNLRKISSLEGSLAGTPRWSSDSKQIIFDARTNGQVDLYKALLDENSPVQITQTPYNEIGGSWSADGNWIYYSSNKTGVWEIWKMNVDGEESTQVTYDGGMGAFESKDGKFLFHSKKNTPGIWKLNLLTLEEERIIDNLMPNDWASWGVSEDGIFYISRGPTAISYYNFETKEISRVFKPEKGVPHMDAALSVSEDGTELLLGQVDDSSRDIMMIDNFGAVQ